MNWQSSRAEIPGFILTEPLGKTDFIQIFTKLAYHNASEKWKTISKSLHFHVVVDGFYENRIDIPTKIGI